MESLRFCSGKKGPGSLEINQGPCSIDRTILILFKLLLLHYSPAFDNQMHALSAAARDPQHIKRWLRPHQATAADCS